MTIYICKECGTSFPEALSPPERCPICEDERQYVPRTRQAWTTPDELSSNHVNAWRELEPNLFEIHTEPEFAIGQRALLVRTPKGNYLWDCLALIDEATIALVNGLGSLVGIAISHPHYYTRCQDWARAFGCRVYLHGADREWVVRPDPAIQFWEGDTFELNRDLTLIRLGGHFPGATVLYWTTGARKDGVLLTGDTLQVVEDPRRVTFLWSYPNRIPLSASTVRRIANTLKQWSIDRVYGYSVGRQIDRDGNAAIEHSAQRYIQMLSEDH